MVDVWATSHGEGCVTGRCIASSLMLINFPILDSGKSNLKMLITGLWIIRQKEKCFFCEELLDGLACERDHSHKTGYARGVLCVKNQCNRKLNEMVEEKYVNVGEYLKKQ